MSQNSLTDLKSRLSGAPVDVKSAFNSVINYFSTSSNPKSTSMINKDSTVQNLQSYIVYSQDKKLISPKEFRISLIKYISTNDINYAISKIKESLGPNFYSPLKYIRI